MKYGKFKDDGPPRKDSDNDDRDKPSWREMDAKRDRKQYFDSNAPASSSKPKGYKDKRAQTEAKNALNDLFKPKSSKEQEAAWKTVTESKGDKFSTEANVYVEKFGMPNEWDQLLRLLDHSNAKFVEQVLDKIEDLLPNETDMRKELLSGKLRVLKLERDEPELLSKFEEVIHMSVVREND